ncbi:MAG: hypothetical protein K9M75_03005 [Phycisphaerae bacterium]|nr:hypothetical protein [Phycisphaerae bacterium]
MGVIVKLIDKYTGIDASVVSTSPKNKSDQLIFIARCRVIIGSNRQALL